MECVYCLLNVSIASGMCLLLVKCVYSFLNVTIACGMCVLLVECVYSLWNVSNGCLMFGSLFNVRYVTLVVGM